MRKIVNLVLSGLKYIIGLFMVYAGPATAFGPMDYSSKLGFIYANRFTLVLLGLIFFFSGLTLFVGKVLKRKQMIGHGLMAIYLCFLFAGLINWYATGWNTAWGNLIASAITGALYLRWKYHIYYVQPLDTHAPVV